MYCFSSTEKETLGVIFNENLSMKDHVSNVCKEDSINCVDYSKLGDTSFITPLKV